MPYLDKKKQRAAQLSYVRKNRDEWLAENGPCWWCGSDDHLEVDHIDPSEKSDHRIWSWSKARRDAELAKCQVLCRACHRLKSRAAYRKNYVHGTDYCYRRLECRCQLCRDANTQRVYANRDKRMAEKAARHKVRHMVPQPTLGNHAA